MGRMKKGASDRAAKITRQRGDANRLGRGAVCSLLAPHRAHEAARRSLRKGQHGTGKLSAGKRWSGRFGGLPRERTLSRVVVRPVESRSVAMQPSPSQSQRDRGVSDLHYYKQLKAAPPASPGKQGSGGGRLVRTRSGSTASQVSQADSERELLDGSEASLQRSISRPGRQCSRLTAHDGLSILLIATITTPVGIKGLMLTRRGEDLDGAQLQLIAGMTLPLQLVALILHMLIGHPLWAAVPEEMHWLDVRRCCTSGLASKLLGCGVVDPTVDRAEYERTVRALPNKRMWLHLVLYTINLFVFWGDRSLIYARSAAADEADFKMIPALAAGLRSPFTWIMIAFFTILGMWCAVQMRKGVLMVCRTKRALMEYALFTGKVAGAVLLWQTWMLMQFWMYLQRAMAARELARGGSGPGGAVSLYDDVGRVAMSIVEASTFLAWLFPWLVGVRRLSVLVDDGSTLSTFAQIFLVVLMLLAVLYDYARADKQMLLQKDEEFGVLCRDQETDRILPLNEYEPESNTYSEDGTGQCGTNVEILILWPIVTLLLANDVRKMKRLLELPEGKQYHFFICHHQASGGNQASHLCDQLTDLGCSVWYDNAVALNERNLDGMRRGVRESVTCLIFHSGRREHDKDGKSLGYEGTFTRWFCNEEMSTARKAGLHIMGVKETDGRFGAPDMEAEKERAMTGGKDGGPVHEQAAENLKLLTKVCFISRRTQQHELPAYLNEIIAEGIKAAQERQQEEPPPSPSPEEDESLEVDLESPRSSSSGP